MARYRILYAAMFIGAAAFALAYESKLTFVLFAGVIVLPIVTLILLILSGLLLKLEVLPDTEYVGKLQTFSVAVKVTNRFIVPVSPMMITCTFHDRDGSVISGRRLVLNASPLRQCEYVFSGNIRYRGEYTLGVDHAEIYDLLRIFKFRIRNVPVCNITVTPCRIMLDEHSALCTDDYDSNITKISFMESSSFSTVRPYNDGDPLKHVHWKLSAKHDELMVKQSEQNLGSSALIITDMHSVSDDDEENLRAADAAAEAALALTKKIISDGRTAVNVYRSEGGKAEVLSAEKHDDHEQLLATFAVLPVTDAMHGAETLVPKAAEMLSGNEPLFIITPELTGEAFDLILRSVGELCGDIRVYLTAKRPDAELRTAVEGAKNASVFFIDPEDISLSLSNSMSV